jgi:hypothetical protein
MDPWNWEETVLAKDRSNLLKTTFTQHQRQYISHASVVESERDYAKRYFNY